MPGQAQRSVGWSESRELPSGAVFFASRVFNGVLILVQVALVGRLYGSTAAARFFVFWTILWCGSVWLRFGIDQLIPKFAAYTRLREGRNGLGGFAPILRITLPLLAIAAPVLLAALVPGIGWGGVALALPILLAGAVAWAAIYVLSALVKGYGRPGLSGIILGAVPAALFTLAVPLAHLASGSWEALAGASSAALVLAAGVAAAAAVISVGAHEVRQVLSAGWSGRRDPDVVPAGILQGISETSIWLPVWMGAALGLPPLALAGLYAAVRASSAFSWPFSAVVTVITPKLAGALAVRDLDRVQQLLIRSAKLGVIVTGPLVVIGVALAGSMLGWVHPGYAAFGGVLIALLLARFVDAATGAVAEALILGDRAWTELANQLVAVFLLSVLAVVLHPTLGTLGLGIACAVASAVANLLRTGEVALLLRGGWQRWGWPTTGALRRHSLAIGASTALMAAAAVVALLTLAWWFGIDTSAGRLLLFMWTALLGAAMAASATRGVVRLAEEPPRTAGEAVTLRHRSARLLVSGAAAGWAGTRRVVVAGGRCARAGLSVLRETDGRAAAALLLLALCADAAWVIALYPRALPGLLSLGIALLLVAAVIAVVSIEVRRRFPEGRRQLVISPLSLAVVIWVITFLLRPLQLLAWPSSASYSLWQLGFDAGDLARAVAIGAVGCAAWSAGNLLAMGRRIGPRTPPGPERAWPLRTESASLLLGLGTLLWGVLFLRQGGIHQLLNSPAAIRKGQQSSGYGFIGIWLVQAVALYAWGAVLNGGGRRVARILVAAALLSLAGGVCLQLRQLTVMTLLGAALIYLRYRRPSRRAIVTAVTIVALGVPALAFASTFRNYTQFVPLGRSLSLTLHTPPSSFDSADLGTFDNMAVITKLVPNSVPWLGGRTLWAIPEALVPRSIWPSKPQPVDQQVTDLLLPGQVGGTPIMAQGELYWNLGLPAVALGALLLGLLLGGVTRLGLSVTGRAGLLLYAVVVPATLTLLTRALATMTGNLVLALVATLLVLAVLPMPLQPLFGFADGARARLGRVGVRRT